jgi:SecD/SecF fusion protein
MNAKNLPLKFAFLSLLVAVCIYSLCVKGLKEGIDLRGGHSLTFRIRSNADEVNRLKIRQAELVAKIEAATNEDEKELLVETANRLKGDLAQAIRDAASDSSLAVDMIRVLKERVDPMGLKMLEWRPVGANRFEVRMPAGNAETQIAKDKFRRAIQDLERRNIEKSSLRNLEKGRTTIAKLAGDDARLSELLGKLTAAYTELQAATSENIQTRTSNWENAEETVLRYNVAIQDLRSKLAGYVRPTDMNKVKNQPKARTALEARQKGYENSIAEFLDKHKDNAKRFEALENIVELYTKWVDMRQDLEDPSDLKRLIAKAGALEFRIAPMSSAMSQDGQLTLSPTEQDKYFKILTDTLDKEGPQGLSRRTDRYMWFPIRGEKKSGYGRVVTLSHNSRQYILLANFKGKTLLQRRDAERWALTNAYITSDSKNLPAVGFSMNDAGANLLHALTGSNMGEHMAILLDNEVYSAPVIQAAISSSGIITMGTIDPEEVNNLIKTLRAGSLPAKLVETPVAESSFGPTFGKANRDMGFRAGIIGLIAVAGFMCLYYRGAGLIAILALVLNVVLVLGTMSLWGAVFTLPGIAGIILTVGIAVDANVLIFERLREEQARGTAIRRAMANAYQRAFSAIFDANITTLIVCLILGWVGTEEVRGFAVTLSFGVMYSMFTALVLTRWIFQILLDRGIIVKPLKMMHVIGVPKVNWMAKRHFFWVLSATMVVIGIFSMVGQGSNLLGIEFSAGTQAVITFKDDATIDGKLPDAEIVRENYMAEVNKLVKTDYEKFGKLAETTRIEARYNYNKIPEFVKRRDSDDNGTISRKEFDALPLANAAFFKLLDANSDDVLDTTELEKLPDTSYQITTTDESVPKISGIATSKFGESLKRRVSYTQKTDKVDGYTVVTGEMITELDLEAGSDGFAEVSPKTSTPHTEILEDFNGGVVIALRGLTPKMTARDLQERIENTQMQQDVAKSVLNRVRVIALGAASEPLQSDFAIFSRSSASDGNSGLEPAALHGSLQSLVTQSLQRDEAIVAINFDPAIASGAAQSAILAIIMSWIAIVLYVWVRFGSIRWGLAAVICLIHDVVIVVGLLAASLWIADTWLGGILGVGSFKVDLAMVAAILTVIGYSVNDTIVVFDRIRENRGKLASVSVMALNASINQTLGRTLLTSTTTLIVVVIMYVSGGDAIRPFSFALLIGVLFGTYSSIAIASPLLMGLRKALVARTAGMVDTEE